MNRVLFASASEHWSTPANVYESLNREFHFTLDPCPLNATEDGTARLFSPWLGHRVFCNPPYREIRKWLELWREAALAVYLIPARTDTRWFHQICLPYAEEIRFLRGRLRFGTASNCAPFPSMVVVFRSTVDVGSNHDGLDGRIRNESGNAEAPQAQGVAYTGI
jgi:hypothetical protein